MKLREILRRRFLLALSGLAAFFLPFSEAAAQSPDGDVKLGNALVAAAQSYADGDYNAVISLLAPLSEQYPDEGAVWYYLGMSRLYRRDYEAGTQALGKAAECDPGNYWYRYYYNLARVYYREDPAEGIAGYEELLRDYPARAELNYQLADIYMRSGRTDDGLALLDKIEELQGKDEAMTLYRYEVLSSIGREDEAVAALVSYNEESPSPRILKEIGTFYQAHDRDSLAREAFEAAHELDPTDLTATLGLSETLVSLGEEELWYDLMRNVMEDDSTPVSFAATYLKNQSNPYTRRQIKHPERIDTLADLALAAHPADTTLIRPAGLYFNSVGNTERAREVMLGGVKAHPQDWDLQLFYIQYLIYLKDLGAASAAADAAYLANPGDVRYLELKNYIDYQRKDYEALLRNSEAIMAISPKDSDSYISAYANIGDIYHEMGNDKQAFKIYKKVLKLRPDYAPTLNNYAYYLSLQGKQLKKAYRMSKKSVEVDPDNGTYLDTFGWILHLMGRDIEAKPIFKQALLYGGSDSATILDHYARVLETLKETELAKVYWRQALAKAGDEDEALKESIREKLAGK